MQITFPGGGATEANYIAETMPAWVYTDSFTVAGWFRRRAAADSAFRAIAFVPNLFLLRSSGTVVSVQVFTNVATGQVNISGIANGEWVYVAASYDVGTGAIVLVARSENMARSANTGTLATGARTTGTAKIGKNKATSEGGGAGTATAMDGEISGLCIKSGARTKAQLEAMVDAAFTSGYSRHALEYVGSGFLGINDLKWVELLGVMRQAPDVGNGGARAGVAVTADNFVFQYFDESADFIGASANSVASNAEVEAVFGRTGTATINGTLTYANSDPAFFQLQAPGQLVDGNNGVGSSAFVRMRAGTPQGQERATHCSNSRGGRSVWYAGGPEIWGVWSGNHCNGAAAARLSVLGGAHNFAVSRATWRRPFFDCTAVPYNSGTVDSITSGTYDDFTRGFTGSMVEGSPGPGGGVRLGSTGAAIAQRCVFTAGTRLDGTTQVLHEAVLPEYPGHPGSFDWAIEDAAAITGTGTVVLSGTETGMDTEEGTHTFSVVNDVYNAGGPSLTLEDFDSDLATSIQGHLNGGAIVVVYVKSGTGVGSLAQIVAVTPGSETVLTLRHALGNSVGNNAVLSFGVWRYRRLRVVAPVPTAACQGFTISGNAGVVWYSVSVEAVGLDLYSMGTFGWGGHGYSDQINEGFLGMYPLIFEAIGSTSVYLYHATQNTIGPEDRMTFAALVPLEASKVILMADQMHRIVDATTVAWAEASLLQTTHPAVVGTEGAGSLTWADSEGEVQNNSHPAVENMYRLFNSSMEAGASIPSTGVPAGSAPRLRSQSRDRRSMCSVL